MENKKKFNEVKKALIDHLKTIKYTGDLSDIGNEIGFIIGDHISNEMGYEKNAFLYGLNHGFSLKDGTHGQPHP
jgi:hypothetical protein